jgi:hypothetical protein
MKKILTIICIIIFITGCSNSKVQNNSEKVKESKEVVEKTETSSKEIDEIITTKDLIEKFKEEKIPIEKTIEYTAETDKNNFLGRPGQYIAKSDFWDNRLEVNEDNYCSIEVFNNTKDLENRKKYIEGIIESMPIMTQYLYSNNTILLRLPKAMNPSQADEYKKVLESF